MKNNKVLYGIIGLVALVIVNLVVFISIKEFSTAIYINIAFLNISVLNLWFFSIMFGDKKEGFMNYTRLPMVSLYSVVTFILSALLVLINFQNVKVTIAIQVILLGIYIILLATNTMANNSARNSVAIDKNNYGKVNDMTKRLDLILKTVENREVYKKIEKAYDAVKNTKVTVNQDTTQVDNDILQSIGIIEYSVQNKNFDAIDEQVEKIKNAIIRRNEM